MMLKASKIRFDYFYIISSKNKLHLIIKKIPYFRPHEIVRQVEIMGCNSRIFTRVGLGLENLKSQTKNYALRKGFLKNYARKL